VVRELALVKVRADGKARSEVIRLCEVFRARVVDVGTEALVAEITGTADKIDGLVDVLRPFGLVEIVRTGAVAMRRSAEAGIETDDDGSARAEASPARAETKAA
jgi:acetolactate synthase-1/3 small subunit